MSTISYIACAIAVLMCAAHAATVTGVIQTSQATGTTTSVRFVPLSNPQVREGIVITSDVVTLSATNGTFSATLHPGDYEVVVGGRDTFQIAVPSGDSTHNIQSLITTGLTYTYGALPTRWSLSPATDTELGGVTLVQADGDTSWVVPTLAYSTNAFSSRDYLTNYVENYVGFAGVFGGESSPEGVVTAISTNRIYVRHNGTEIQQVYVHGGPAGAATNWMGGIYPASDYFAPVMLSTSSIELLAALESVARHDIPSYVGLNPRSGDFVSGTLYAHEPTGSVWGLGYDIGSDYIAWVNLGNRGRIQWHGAVRAVEFYAHPDFPTNCQFVVQFWRKGNDDERWRMVGETEDLTPSVTPGVTNTIELSKQVVGLKMGDAIGCKVTYHEDTWGAVVTLASEAEHDFDFTYTAAVQDGIDWGNLNYRTNRGVAIHCIMDAPICVWMGDSRVSGALVSRSLTYGDTYWNNYGDPAYQFSEITGLSCFNVGYEGLDSGEMEDRFAEYVTAYDPQFVILSPGDWNDWYHQPDPRTVSDYTLSVSNMITAAIGNGSRVLVTSPYPVSAMDPVYQPPALIQFYNGLWDLVNTQWTRDQVRFVSVMEDLGEEREELAPENNRFNIKSSFAAGDGLHWTRPGVYAFAGVPARAIREWLRDIVRLDITPVTP